MKLPDLNLSLGQLLWAVRYGQQPDQRLRNAIRYLRLKNVLQASTEQASGAGNRVRYGFHDLVEVGLAVTALDLGLRPKDFIEVLVDQRDKMRKVYEQAWQELPEAALGAKWVRSRGRIKALLDNERHLRLHDRRSDQWGELDFVSAEEASAILPVLEPIERFANEPPRRLLPLKRLMLQWVAWALEAPEIKPGRK